MFALMKLFAIFVTTTLALSNRDAGAAAEGPARVKRQISSVSTDLLMLSTSYATLSVAITRYTGGVAGAVPIMSAASAVQSQYGKTIIDANNSPQASVSQAQAICDYFNTFLNPITRNALNALIARKGLFVNAGLKSAVLSQLSTLSSSARSLGTALNLKAPSARTSCVSSISSVAVSLYSSAISTFAS